MQVAAAWGGFRVVRSERNLARSTILCFRSDGRTSRGKNMLRAFATSPNVFTVNHTDSCFPCNVEKCSPFGRIIRFSQKSGAVCCSDIMCFIDQTNYFLALRKDARKITDTTVVYSTRDRTIVNYERTMNIVHIRKI